MNANFENSTTAQKHENKLDISDTAKNSENLNAGTQKNQMSTVAAAKTASAAESLYKHVQAMKTKINQ